MSFPEWVSVVSDTIVALAAVFAGVVAVLGLRTWRHQLRGNAEYELARRLLRALYRTRDAVAACRNVLITAGEMRDALRRQGYSDEEIDARWQAQGEEAVYSARLARIGETLSELDVEAKEYEAIRDPEINVRIAVLRERIGELAMAIRQYLRSERSDRHRLADEDAERIDGILEKDFDAKSEKDTGESFGMRFKEAIAGVEDLVKPMLKL